MKSLKQFIIEETSPTVFYHLSKEDRSKSGISRKFAGSHAAGAEKKRFKFVDGQIDEDTAMVHLYEIHRSPEHRVSGGANWFHRIEIPRIKLVDVEDSTFGKILDSISDMSNLPKAVRSAGYDGIYNYDGLVQIYRDIKPSEIIFSKILTPDDYKLLNTKNGNKIEKI